MARTTDPTPSPLAYTLLPRTASSSSRAPLPPLPRADVGLTVASPRLQCRASCEGRENCAYPSDYCKREGGYGTHDIALIKLARPYKCAYTLKNTLSRS